MGGLYRSIAVRFDCLAAACLIGIGLGAAAAEEKAAVAEKATKAAARQSAEAYVEQDIAERGGGCCGRPAMVPVCRCTPTTRKKPKTEYEVKCERVCVPGCRRVACGSHRAGCCGTGCSGDGCCEKPCGNATIRTKKTLVKKIVDEEEPAMEYEVEWVCANCAGGGLDGCGGHGLLGKPSKAWHAMRCFWQDLWHWK